MVERNQARSVSVGGEQRTVRPDGYAETAVPKLKTSMVASTGSLCAGIGGQVTLILAFTPPEAQRDFDRAWLPIPSVCLIHTQTFQNDEMQFLRNRPVCPTLRIF